MIFVNINIAYLFSSSLQPKFYNSLKSKDENLRKLKVLDALPEEDQVRLF